MNIIGIIVEYNPFHNGHLYHLNEIKKLYPDSLIIACMSGNFNQRGDVSVISKWNKTEIALKYGIDIVIELPYVFASQAADIFAYGGIKILDLMKVNTLVFGSESNDIELLKKMADIQINDDDYENKVKSFIQTGLNYPTSMAKGLKEITEERIDTPNDILGLCYVKQIMKQNSKIEPISILRTNDYHDTQLNNKITSASSIRIALKEGNNIKEYVPKETYNYLTSKLMFNDEYFKFLKYKIISEENLSKYHTVDEGIDYKIKSNIEESKSLSELIKNIKSKRYTFNKISRMLTHILTGFTKEEALNNEIEYIRVLGFSKKGQTYLNEVKKEISVPIITNFKKYKALLIEQRTTDVYASILNEKEKMDMMKSEYKNKPIKRG